MDHLADRLDQAADSLTALAREVPSLALAPDAFATQGLPGQVGRALHERWAAVLEARARETSSAAARLAEVARSVRTTRRHYAETDEAVERHLIQEL
ncbi:hypothetical protein [Actinoplanes solisilvae]|uniref:hypothetical protein n=1 Tax=Actinoplanes solisilvae TaxID=2486853 RepID=UPI000FDAD21C|nr:hypothetical protein [Actinoplanes solisilvae]